MKDPFAVLLIPGFAELPVCVQPLALRVEEQGIAAAIAPLRGHSAASPDALHGVVWRDWMVDAETALAQMLHKADKVIVVGHSMGGLIALNLAADAAPIDSIVLVSICIQPSSLLAPGHPLNAVLPVLRRLMSKHALSPTFAEPVALRYDILYPWAPMDAFTTFMDFCKATRQRLHEVHTPTLIVQSRKDSLVSPESAEMVYNGISTPQFRKDIVWFEHTDHFMLCDCERDGVMAAILHYIRQRVGMADAQEAEQTELVNALWGSK
jgi:carboxylesterase